MMENLKIVTSLNDELTSRYANVTLATWSLEPLVWHEPEDTTPEWHQWREKNRPLHPEPTFARTWQRFSHKVEAQTKLALRLGNQGVRWLIWIDADVIEIARPTELLWREILPPEGQAVTYLGRGDDYHPETGFIAYDLNHPATLSLLRCLELVYLTDEVFTLKEWHDAWVWDWVCRRLDTPRHTLIEGTPRRGEAFARSRLKGHWQHLKGARKYDSTS